jgi:hypothetical protein
VANFGIGALGNNTAAALPAVITDFCQEICQRRSARIPIWPSVLVLFGSSGDALAQIRVNPRLQSSRGLGLISRLETLGWAFGSKLRLVMRMELTVRRASISPKEYRLFAAQCLRWATRAKSEAHKSVMLDMAHHWMQTAQELEQAAGPVMNLGRKPRVSTTPRSRGNVVQESTQLKNTQH